MARQADVSVVHPIPFFPGLRPLPDWAVSNPLVDLAGVTVEHAPMLYIPGMLKFLDAYWMARAISHRISRIDEHCKLDLIDAHFGYPEGAACMAVARRLGLPLFVTIRGFETEFVHRPIIGQHMLSALGYATGVVAVSHSLKAMVLAHGISEDKVCVINNAIDTKTFAYVDQSTVRMSMGIEAGRPLVVSVGHLIGRKRHHVLIEAFAQVAAKFPDARLVIIGGNTFEPGYPRQLNEAVNRLGLTGAVEFLGNRPPQEVAKWLGAADVFSLATAREGCCNAVLEALAVGVPVVTTPVGDNAAFVEPGVNGQLAPVDDVDATAAAITEALSCQTWRRSAISDSLHRRVGDWSTVADRVLRFFQDRLGH